MAGYKGESEARYREEEEEDGEVKSYFPCFLPRLCCYAQSMSTLKMSMEAEIT